MLTEIHVTPSPPGDPDQPYRHVDAAIAAVVDSGLTYEVGALGTTFEGPPDEVWTTLRSVHEACLASGAERVMTHVRMFETADGDTASMADLVAPFRP